MSDESLVKLGGGTWRGDAIEDAEEKAEENADDEPLATDATEATETDGGDREIFGPPDDEFEDGADEASLATDGLSPVNIRNFSVKCGHCGNYQVIVRFRPIDEDWNEYVYECDQSPCAGDVERSRTVLEIPSDLDEYARRNPTWHGGKVHAGAEHRGAGDPDSADEDS